MSYNMVKSPMRGLGDVSVSWGGGAALNPDGPQVQVSTAQTIHGGPSSAVPIAGPSPVPAATAPKGDPCYLAMNQWRANECCVPHGGIDQYNEANGIRVASCKNGVWGWSAVGSNVTEWHPASDNFGFAKGAVAIAPYHGFKVCPQSTGTEKGPAGTYAFNKLMAEDTSKFWTQTNCSPGDDIDPIAVECNFSKYPKFCAVVKSCWPLCGTPLTDNKNYQNWYDWHPSGVDLNALRAAIMADPRSKQANLDLRSQAGASMAPVVQAPILLGGKRVYGVAPRANLNLPTPDGGGGSVLPGGGEGTGVLGMGSDTTMMVVAGAVVLIAAGVGWYLWDKKHGEDAAVGTLCPYISRRRACQERPPG